MSELQNHLDISLRQTVQLSQRMLQSVRILQMGTVELQEFVREQLEENPVLEEVDAPPSEDYFTVRSELSFGSAISRAGENESYDFFRDSIPDRSDAGTLREHLLDQLSSAGADAQVHSLCRYLIYLLDEDGFLDPEDLAALLSQAEIRSDLTERALTLLQSFYPAGVGAASLEECLCLQLKRLPGDHTLAERIVRSELSGLAQGHISSIASRLRVSPEDVCSAAETIRSLNPHPGAAFSSQSDPVYIVPDVSIVMEDGSPQIICNVTSFPQLRLNEFYRSLSDSAQDAKTRSYLHRSTQNAQFLLDTLSHREQTVVACVRVILKRQMGFFTGKSKVLRPLSLRDIASEVGLHEATVSRALAGKYVSCPRGCFPLGFFLVRSSGGEQISNHQIFDELKRIVHAEDVSHPLSDQAISDLLRKRGYSVSRRTVSKYRGILSIPDSSSRRRI